MVIDYVIDGTKTREYWLVFTQGSHLVSRFLKKNFSHIYIITKDEFNWIIINPLRLRLDIEIPPYPINLDIPRILKQEHDHVIKVKMYDKPALKQFGYINLINCVTYTRYILGLRKFVLTPFQLYKSLLRLDQASMAKHGIATVNLIG